MRAGFAFEELFSQDGHMRPIPDGTPRVLGVSRFVYRAWLRELRSYASAIVRGDHDDAFRHEVRLIYFGSYIYTRIDLAAKNELAAADRAAAILTRACARAAMMFFGVLS